MKRKLLWTKQDVHIDSDPRIVRCHPHEAAAVSIYLFLHRLAFIDGATDGALDACRIDPWYLSRMLFLPIDSIFGGLAGMLASRMIMLSSHGTIVTDRDSRDDRDALIKRLENADRVLITDWGPEYSFRPLSDSERQLKARNQRKERRAVLSFREGNEVRDASRTRHDRHAIDQSIEDPEHEDLDLSCPQGGQDQDRAPQEGLAPDPPGTVDSSADDGGLTRQQIRALKIPDRAWWAADSLRRMVIARNPSANIAVKTWDDKIRSPIALDEKQTEIARNRQYVGKIEPLPLERRGNRMRWADTMRKIHEIDGRSWDEIRETMQWLQHGQPARLGTGFIVESPETLREKWGAIALHISDGKQRANNQFRKGDTSGVDKAVSEMNAALGKDGAK